MFVKELLKMKNRLDQFERHFKDKKTKTVRGIEDFREAVVEAIHGSELSCIVAKVEAAGPKVYVTDLGLIENATREGKKVRRLLWIEPGSGIVPEPVFDTTTPVGKRTVGSGKRTVGSTKPDPRVQNDRTLGSTEVSSLGIIPNEESNVTLRERNDRLSASEDEEKPEPTPRSKSQAIEALNDLNPRIREEAVAQVAQILKDDWNDPDSVDGFAARAREVAVDADGQPQPL